MSIIALCIDYNTNNHNNNITYFRFVDLISYHFKWIEMAHQIVAQMKKMEKERAKFRKQVSAQSSKYEILWSQ